MIHFMIFAADWYLIFTIWSHFTDFTPAFRSSIRFYCKICWCIFIFIFILSPFDSIFIVIDSVFIFPSSLFFLASPPPPPPFHLFVWNQLRCRCCCSCCCLIFLLASFFCCWYGFRVQGTHDMHTPTRMWCIVCLKRTTTTTKKTIDNVILFQI